MAIQLPGGLAQMLGKVLGKLPDAPKADAKGLVGQPGQPGQPGAAQTPGGPTKGTPLGEGTVLHGVGYNGADRTGAQKNVHEKDTVARFLKEPDVDKLLGRSTKEPEEPKAAREEKAAEAKDKQDAQRADVRRDEKADEQKAQVVREAQREEAQRDQAHEKEKERQREEHKKDDERGQGAYAEEQEQREDEEAPPEGLYEGDPLGEAFRCKGMHEGVRCLRKPIEGASFCREHLVTPPPARG